MNKFDIIDSNEFGRKKVIRYKQYMFGEVPGIKGFRLDKHGCGPTTMATILSSLGYQEMSPEYMAKRLLLDEHGNQIDFYNDLANGRLGTRDIGFVWLLQQLVQENLCDISYCLVKLSYEHPELKKEEILNMITNEYMAMICVGPWNDKYPKTFSNGGHYIALTSVNRLTNEFYIANPNEFGDKQIDTTFSYETVVSNLYTNCFDFLMIKKDKTFNKHF